MDTYALYRRFLTLPAGRLLFSVAYGLKAPYFRTVQGYVREMREHHAEIVIRKRWGVQNHIGTVHAIAICNGLEMAMGLVAEATTPAAKRWIPRGMEVNYLAKSIGDVLCVAETAPDDWVGAGDVPVRVRALLRDGTVVVEGTITIYVSDRKPR